MTGTPMMEDKEKQRPIAAPYVAMAVALSMVALSPVKAAADNLGLSLKFARPISRTTHYDN
jgi:hypothetical protein